MLNISTLNTCIERLLDMSGSVSNHYFCPKTLGLRAFQAQTGKKQLSRPFILHILELTLVW